MIENPKVKSAIYPGLGLLLLVCGLIVSIFILPFEITGDGVPRYTFMEILVHELQITPIRYSMVGPMFSLPLWLISGLFQDPRAVIERYNLLLFALFLIVLYLWLRSWFERKFLLTFILLLAFASMFPAHLTNFYGDVFSAVCLALGSIALGTKKPTIGWILLILAVLNTPALFIPFFLVVLYLVWETRQLRFFLMLPVCLILVLLEGFIRTGSILGMFQTYLAADHGFQTVLPFSGRAGYSYPFILGVFSILLSFGKGLIFFCPGLLLIVWARKLISNPAERKMLHLWFLIILGLIVAYASWWAWYGGWFWGPRFFLFASVPASWILAKMVHMSQKSLLQSLIVLIFVTVSIWIGVNGVVFQQKTLDVCGENNYALEFLCWYVPEFSPLVRPFIARLSFTLNDMLLLILFTLAWFYLMFPLGMEFIQQVRQAYQTHRPFINLSAWKF